ncbi:MAG: hypothetical protein ACM3OB_03940, partial [Acidobacteriota bacterium]
PPELPPLPVGKDAAVCGSSQPSPRLVLGRQGGVANTVVALEGVQHGRPLPAGVRATLTQRRCQYEPHVLAVPLGAEIEVVNDDPVLHNVHGTDATSRTTLFNVAQPLQGQRSPLGPGSTAKAGLFELSCESGHPWMSGYLLVSEHPYYAVTGADGSFRLDGVPAGTYRLRFWHEGVRVLREIQALQRLEYEPPYEEVREVTVPAGGEVRVDWALELRR